MKYRVEVIVEFREHVEVEAETEREAIDLVRGMPIPELKRLWSVDHVAFASGLVDGKGIPIRF